MAGDEKPGLRGTLKEAVTLAWKFNLATLSSVGGGLGAWIHETVVAREGWLDEEAYASASTLCELLPGSNQMNMAVFVGSSRAGGIGAAAAVAGLVCAPVLLSIGVSHTISSMEPTPGVTSILGGMASASAGLVMSVAIRQGRTTLRGSVSIATCLATAFCVLAHVPLWITLPLCGVPSCAWAWWRRR